MARRPNGRRVKIHYSYTIRAAAEVLGVHKHTVSRWIAAGLSTTDAMRPFLIRGQDLRAFLRARGATKASMAARAMPKLTQGIEAAKTVIIVVA
jgi:excisionase family DNA binding protein